MELFTHTDQLYTHRYFVYVNCSQTVNSSRISFFFCCNMETVGMHWSKNFIRGFTIFYYFIIFIKLLLHFMAFLNKKRYYKILVRLLFLINIENVFFYYFQGTVSVWMNENLSHESLIERPALLFRCDDRIYEIPQLFSCFLRILSFYLTASRCYITQKVSTTPTFSSVK